MKEQIIKKSASNEERRAYWNKMAVLAVEDDEAFALLYDEFFPAVYKFLLSKSCDSEIADEAASRAFLNMHEHLGEYDEKKGAFSTWFFKIAINELRMIFRKNQKSLDTSWDEGFDPPAPKTETPEEKLLKKERDQNLLNAMLQLPKREQEILRFTYWLGFSAEEAAGVLGMTKEAVWASLSRSRKALKKYLENVEGTPIK